MPCMAGDFNAPHTSMCLRMHQGLQEFACWHRVRAHRCSGATSLRHHQAAPQLPFVCILPSILLYLGWECVPGAFTTCGPRITAGELLLTLHCVANLASRDGNYEMGESMLCSESLVFLHNLPCTGVLVNTFFCYCYVLDGNVL